MKKTLLMAAVLAAATVLAAGLTVLPSTVQEAQANPCSVNSEAEGGRGGDGSVGSNGGGASSSSSTDGDYECNFVGPQVFNED